MGNNRPDPVETREVFWESVHTVAEAVSHAVGHGAHLVGNFTAAELGSIAMVGAHLGLGASAAYHGDWASAGDHMGDMANAALSSATGGIVGCAETAYDAHAAAQRLAGHDVPYSADIRHEGFRDFGGGLADKVFFLTHPHALPGDGKDFVAHHAPHGPAHDPVHHPDVGICLPGDRGDAGPHDVPPHHEVAPVHHEVAPVHQEVGPAPHEDPNVGPHLG